MTDATIKTVLYPPSNLYIEALISNVIQRLNEIMRLGLQSNMTHVFITRR
jgi:hypothetical protein